MEGLPAEYVTSSHTLVWPLFIASLESQDMEQRDYFTGMLEMLHRRLGFNNVAKALEFISLFWTGRTQRNWAQFLTNLDVFIF